MRNFSKIVSANYHDRERVTGNPWLIRGFDQRAKEAVPTQAILATGVAFCPSSDHELGFGCTIVAYCETAEPIPEPRTDGVRLKFDYDGFYDPDDNLVETVDQLVLNPDGSMYSVPLVAQEPAAKPRRQRKKELADA